MALELEPEPPAFDDAPFDELEPLPLEPEVLPPPEEPPMAAIIAAIA